MVFISCLPGGDCENSMGYNNCITYDDCTNKSDCKDGYFCNIGVGKCYPNPCEQDSYLDCGLGKCVIDDYGHASCQCDEGYKSSELGKCILMCDEDIDCNGYKSGDRDLPYCDPKYGHCVAHDPNY